MLRETGLKVIEKLGHEGLVIGGKSMGGRIASLVADEAGVGRTGVPGVSVSSGRQARPASSRHLRRSRRRR